MSRIFNKSGYPDELLRPLIVGAARCVHAKSDIVLLIGKRRKFYHGCYGATYKAVAVRPGRYWAGRRNRNRYYQTNGGWVEIVLPDLHYRNTRPLPDPLYITEGIFKLLLHEFYHIKELQEGTMYKLGCSSRRGGKRRPAWGMRPEEVRAVDAVDDAIKNGAIQRYTDAILNLAVWIEEQIKVFMVES